MYLHEEVLAKGPGATVILIATDNYTPAKGESVQQQACISPTGLTAMFTGVELTC